MIMLQIHFQLLVVCSILKHVITPKGKVMLAGLFKNYDVIKQQRHLFPLQKSYLVVVGFLKNKFLFSFYTLLCCDFSC